MKSEVCRNKSPRDRATRCIRECVSFQNTKQTKTHTRINMINNITIKMHAQRMRRKSLRQHIQKQPETEHTRTRYTRTHDRVRRDTSCIYCARLARYVVLRSRVGCLLISRTWRQQHQTNGNGNKPQKQDSVIAYSTNTGKTKRHNIETNRSDKNTKHFLQK